MVNNSTYLQPLLIENCETLAIKFKQLDSTESVAELLEVPFEYLTYYLYRMSSDNKYTVFNIPKKSGDIRSIYSPHSSLGIIQRKLSQVLYAIYKPRPSVHGFTPSKSIITNARTHVKKRFILNIDIRNFFSSINFGRVRGMFMGNPYQLNNKVATVLAQICCFNNILPQGAPSSPIVSNLICAKMDSELQRFAKKYNLFYTRYADDITFSSNRKELPKELVAIYNLNSTQVLLGEQLKRIIEENGFEINYSKVRLLYKTQRQEVTGLIVNETVNVNRKYIRNIQATLHAWEKYGLDAVSKIYQEKYAKRKTPPNKLEADFLDSLRGKIEFVGSVKGKNNQVYLKIVALFKKLRDKATN